MAIETATIAKNSSPLPRKTDPKNRSSRSPSWSLTTPMNHRNAIPASGASTNAVPILVAAGHPGHLRERIVGGDRAAQQDQAGREQHGEQDAGEARGSGGCREPTDRSGAAGVVHDRLSSRNCALPAATAAGHAEQRDGPPESGDEPPRDDRGNRVAHRSEVGSERRQLLAMLDPAEYQGGQADENHCHPEHLGGLTYGSRSRSFSERYRKKIW